MKGDELCVLVELISEQTVTVDIKYNTSLKLKVIKYSEPSSISG